MGQELPAALPGIIDVLIDDKAEMHYQVIMALSGHAASVQPVLAQMLKNTSNDVRRRLAIVVARMAHSGQNGVPLLTGALKDRDDQVRSKARPELCRLGALAKMPLPALLEMLKDPNADIRCDAVKALGDCGEQLKPVAVVPESFAMPRGMPGRLWVNAPSRVHHAAANPKC